MKRQALRDIGFSESEIEELQSAMKEALNSGNRYERRDTYFVPRPQLDSMGGIIKNQFGGVAGGTKSGLGITERRVDTTGTNYKNAAGIIGDSKN